jgi:hypothetical protein
MANGAAGRAADDAVSAVAGATANVSALLTCLGSVPQVPLELQEEVNVCCMSRNVLSAGAHSHVYVCTYVPICVHQLHAAQVHGAGAWCRGAPVVVYMLIDMHDSAECFVLAMCLRVAA